MSSCPLVPFWIDGQRATAHSTRRGVVTNPSTGEQIRNVPMADAADIDAAVQSARRAFPGWRATTPLRRARILARFRELLEANQKAIATLISEEHGKVFLDAMGSVQRGIEVVEFATGAPHLLKGSFSESVGSDVDAYSILQPVGVCAGITPFNFPAMVPLWMFPVALACGNCFVLKPSEKDPSPSVLMAELLKAGRLAGRCVQRRARRQGSGGGHPGAPWHRCRVVRRLDADRQTHLHHGSRRTENACRLLAARRTMRW